MTGQLHFSFSTLSYKDIGLDAALYQALDLRAAENGITLQRKGLGQRLEELIQALGNGPQKLVILIDEYDKPLVDYIENIPQAEANRNILKNFFSVIKDADPFIRFFLITGVSKFSKVSLFSDLNHLEDLTINPLSATLTGYSQAEMESYFSEEIDHIAAENGKIREVVVEEIRRWYNGYRWWGKETLYNPFSVLNLVKSRTFRNYWWDSGTPTFLLKLLRKNFQYDFSQISGGSSIFESFTIEKMDWRSLMFQTGYLTLKAYDPEYEVYTLGYPRKSKTPCFNTCWRPG
ncbi:MAG: AAA family ATPase [Bacteroidia bacterium]